MHQSLRSLSGPMPDVPAPSHNRGILPQDVVSLGSLTITGFLPTNLTNHRSGRYKKNIIPKGRVRAAENGSDERNANGVFKHPKGKTPSK